MKSPRLLVFAILSVAVLTLHAGLPAPPSETKSTDDIFSYFERYKANNSTLEWARFSRTQGELFVIWQCYNLGSGKPWISADCYRKDAETWRRFDSFELEATGGDISVELRRADDKLVVRDAHDQPRKAIAIPTN